MQLSPDLSPLDVIRSLWRAYKKAQKAEGLGSSRLEPEVSPSVGLITQPQAPPSDPETFQRQLELEDRRLERGKLELQILQEKRALKAQEITKIDKQRKSNYWKAVKSGEAPPPGSWQQPAPSPESSPLVGRTLLEPSLIEIDRYGSCLKCNESIGWLPESKQAHSKVCPGVSK